MELRLCIDCGRLSAPGQSRCARCGGGIRIDDARALLGREFGRYRLIDVIGAGGMGIVYLAEHVGLARRVALKLLLPTLDEAGFLERFRREARLLATLEHRHIVDVLDFDVSPDGVPFYAMERLRGCTLARALAALRRPLRLAEIAGVIGDIARALAHAHEHRVVHHDLKPDNIFLAIEDEAIVPKLLDFGIAKQLDQDERAARLTSTGMVMGTPLYLTPEQLGGGEVGPATDQYALALIVAECLLGRPLRQGQSVTQMLHAAVQERTLEALAGLGLPVAVTALLQRATAFEPGARHADVLVLAQALRELAGGDDRGWLDVVRVESALAAARFDAATTPAPTTPMPHAATPLPAPTPATTPLPRIAPATARPRWQPMWVLPMLLLSILAAAWLLRSPPAPPISPNAAAPAATHRLDPAAAALSLAPGLRLRPPADAGALLGVGELGAVLVTGGGVYQQPLATAATAARQAAVAGERVVAVASGGGLVVQTQDRLLERDPRGNGERAIGTLPANAEVIAVDARAQSVLFDDGNRLHFHADGVTHALASVPRARLQFARIGREALLLALSAPFELVLLDPRQDRLLWSSPRAEVRLHDLAWNEASGDIAVCGFSPQVEWFRIGNAAPPRLIEVPVSCYAALWLADGPSLLLRAENALLLWRDGERQRLPWPLRASANAPILPRLAAASGRIWLGEPEAGELVELRLGADVPAALNAQPLGEIWDLQADAAHVYAGTASGDLWQLQQGSAHSLHVHDAGISAIALGKDALATASDDRTVAVWRQPQLELRWRTRGHEFLVNQLWLAPEEDALWSSSSDGTLKRWRWPDLELLESIDVRALTGAKLSLHALWFDAAQDQALVGSWNHQLVHLHRDGEHWRARTFAVSGSGGYRLQHVPEARAVVLLTTAPTRLYAWDLQRSALRAMPDFDLDLLALAPGDRGDDVFVAGTGVVLQQRLGRDTNGELVFASRVLQRTALGTISAAAAQPATASWLVATDGYVRRIPYSWLGFVDAAPER